MIDTYGVVIDFAKTHRTGLARRGMAEWETIDLANPTEEHRMLTGDGSRLCTRRG